MKMVKTETQSGGKHLAIQDACHPTTYKTCVQIRKLVATVANTGKRDGL